MNEAEYSKFTKSLASGYKELITHRPEKPLEHFVFHLLSKVPEEMREKDELISEFYKKYEETDLKKVESLDAANNWSVILTPHPPFPSFAITYYRSFPKPTSAHFSKSNYLHTAIYHSSLIIQINHFLASE